jgi:ferric-dicitrate binding protein FerR (iron transport regulator)
MYGQGEGQSFHEAWKASRAFANPVTLAMRNPNRQPPRARRSASYWKAALVVLVIAALIWVGLLVYRRFRG